MGRWRTRFGGRVGAGLLHIHESFNIGIKGYVGQESQMGSLLLVMRSHYHEVSMSNFRVEVSYIRQRWIELDEE